MTSSLSITNHDRDAAGLQYVYPVLSRRAGGLSVGINFNTNNACNWRCIYCQVPNLTKGAAPTLNLQVLRDELSLFFYDIQCGGFYERFQVEQKHRVIKDIAISGNGEATSLKNFAQAVTVIGEQCTALGVLPGVKFVLITNGSLIHQTAVRDGLMALQRFGGEVWFKLDSATKEGRASINETTQSLKKSIENLTLSSQLCCTKIQTCVFDRAGNGLSMAEKQSYLAAVKQIKATTTINEIMLYTLARPSMQPEANQLKALPLAVLNAFADEIRQLGFVVSVSG